MKQNVIPIPKDLRPNYEGPEGLGFLGRTAAEEMLGIAAQRRQTSQKTRRKKSTEKKGGNHEKH